MANCGLEDRAGHVALGLRDNSSLRDLDISGNPWSTFGLHRLFGVVASSNSLSILSLPFASSDASAAKLAAMISYNHSLEVLKLRGMFPSYAQCDLIIPALSRNTTLQIVDMSSCFGITGHKAWDALLKVARTHPTIRKIVVHESGLSRRRRARLEQEIRVNASANAGRSPESQAAAICAQAEGLPGGPEPAFDFTQAYGDLSKCTAADIVELVRRSDGTLPPGLSSFKQQLIRLWRDKWKARTESAAARAPLVSHNVLGKFQELKLDEHGLKLGNNSSIYCSCKSWMWSEVAGLALPQFEHEPECALLLLALIPSIQLELPLSPSPGTSAPASSCTGVAIGIHQLFVDGFPGWVDAERAVEVLCTALLSQQWNTTVRHLKVRVTAKKGYSHLSHLLRSEHCKLQSLCLSWESAFQASWVRHIAQGLETNSSLTRLDLSNCTGMGDAGVAAMLSSNSTLQDLDLHHTRIPGAAVGQLFDALARPESCGLQTLEITFSFLRGAQVFLGNMLAHNRSLRKLNMESCDLFDEAGHVGLGLQENSTLQELNLSLNPWSVKGSQLLYRAVATSSSLRKLRLAGLTTFGVHNAGEPACSSSAPELAAMISSNHSLEKLDLTCADFSQAEWANLILPALSVNTRLQSVNLSFCYEIRGDKVSDALLKVARTNQTVHTIDVHGTKYSRRRKELLEGMLRRRRP